VVSSRVPSPAKIGSCGMDSNPSGWAKVTIPSGGHFAQDGATVQAFAIRQMTDLVCDARKHLKCNDGYFIGHQANLKALKSVCARTGVPDDKHLYNVDEFGNCGAAGAPSVLSQHWSSFQPNDNVVIAVVGSGLSWAGLWVQFTSDQPSADSTV
jgi:3-oxoacyl-[acyl-carrier-protein] synthase III